MPDTPVRYVRVKTDGVPFAPAVRAYGNVGIIGVATPPANPPGDFLAPNVPTLFTDVNEARRIATGPLGDAIATALVQEPGPSEVWGVRLAQANTYDDALAKMGTVNVQLVLFAGTALSVSTPTGGQPTPTPAIVKLAEHVDAPVADGMERIGVAMLAKGAADPAVVVGSLVSERMVYVAHKSNEDVAAAVAGTIAGYEPHVSLLLKRVKVSSDAFSAQELVKLNGSEPPDAGGPAGKGVNWLVDPPLIPGAGVYLGEGYTGDPGKKKYIDIVRTVDDITFRLKARLIGTIGNLRISRSGLRGLVAEMEAVLEPLRRGEVIEEYEIVVPILALLDKPQRTPLEDRLIQDAQTDRAAEAMVRVDYAGAIHRINITLKFD
ncbi:hypothetical protein AQF52_0299 [Streptomyces venezuelae]|uniref:hypothetical protein n=1 Tax=Streptomyces gardneri TaxID=66892 RepID=UPI0006BD1605|nr:hypothetical protein [Streptomyces gardneri]ALO05899.1 hypothetical protein AQF52_0299 [Streptomyces venezuelae]WRK34650.1 hypothetical protein U0M97_01430 [Streptomyces venezuelae]CUM43884.1 hypothetical protein BN2537_16733 [Streptomyces venezuelae]